MIIKRLVLGPLQVNTYIIKSRGECLVVDPGECIGEEISRLGCRRIIVAVTHGHFDHTQGVDCLKDDGATLAAHPLEPQVARESASLARAWGLKAHTQEAEPDLELGEGDTLEIGGLAFRAIHTPGHSPDHIILYNEDPPLALVGDLIFMGSIGRVDLPGSNPRDMKASIEKAKSVISPQARLLPGHGPETSMEGELERNPFLRNPSLILPP
ncbi:MAG: MBL fold metallo-hydrolase [Desulfurococcales archaeon]|nr:MBL fold metallo-hydrolase [Desulfurococcales archaeon]